ncbi:anti-sigma factor [Pseudovibrio sp. Alg231-02]|uniref:anti-sigma factor n=1 Tax=Pseudovibrio sp. Alg231-02 TaxID=1922223 RepID=UPI000D557BF7|nr:anti-sigma factor [Pseudovibrio sp. Alg231-02]
MTYTDEHLRSYLAGSLDSETAQQIEADLESDPILEQRLLALEGLLPVVQQGFAEIPDADHLKQLEDKIFAQPTPANDHAAAPTFVRTWSTRAATLVIGLAIGTGFMYWADDATDWRQEVASYQALYVKETIASLNRSEDELKQELAEASTAVGQQLNLSDLNDLEGLKLLRTQVLGHEGAPLIQIVFADPNGAPVAFCILKDTDAAGTIMQSTSLKGMASADWTGNGYRYLVIGGQNQSRIDTVAEQIHSRVL